MSRSIEFEKIMYAIEAVLRRSNNPTLNDFLVDSAFSFERLAMAARASENSTDNVDYVSAMVRLITKEATA